MNINIELTERDISAVSHDKESVTLNLNLNLINDQNLNVTIPITILKHLILDNDRFMNSD